MAQDETGRQLERHERFRGEYPIEVEGLTNRFGDQVIHQDLDLKVRRCEILGVVGGSGTGKSVLMRSIIGLQTPTQGDIRVFGRSIIDTDPEDEQIVQRILRVVELRARYILDDGIVR